MSDSSVIDPAAHERLLEWGGAKLLGQMLRLFLENSGERMQQIAQGFEEGSVKLVEHGSHSLKSSAANVGAVRVSELAAQIEDLSSSGDLEGARVFHQDLVHSLAEAEEELRTIEGGVQE